MGEGFLWATWREELGFLWGGFGRRGRESGWVWEKGEGEGEGEGGRESGWVWEKGDRRRGGAGGGRGRREIGSGEGGIGAGEGRGDRRRGGERRSAGRTERVGGEEIERGRKRAHFESANVTMGTADFGR